MLPGYIAKPLLNKQVQRPSQSKAPAGILPFLRQPAPGMHAGQNTDTKLLAQAAPKSKCMCLAMC
jgi:hypothetical protein